MSETEKDCPRPFAHLRRGLAALARVYEKSFLEEHGAKKHGDSWNLRLWPGSDLFPMGQEGSTHPLHLLSVLPATGM